MDGWLGFLAVIAVWIALQKWLLPRIGVPT
jgi:hypothetical protein